MSIQLKLGGHSFSVESLSEDIKNGSSEVEFVVMTHKNALIPLEMFDPTTAADYLAINGIGCAASESVVCSSANVAIVAAIAIDSNCLASINSILGSRAIFTTPLLTEPSSNNLSIWLYRCEGLLYIKVYDKTLRFAESIVATSHADIIYYISKLQGEFGTESRTLIVSGSETEAIAKLLKRYFKFKNIICE